MKHFVRSIGRLIDWRIRFGDWGSISPVGTVAYVTLIGAQFGVVCWLEQLHQCPRGSQNGQTGDTERADGIIWARFSGHSTIFPCQIDSEKATEACKL